jgi:transcriptional regulator with GAF, ATPase, and Fis domain
VGQDGRPFAYRIGRGGESELIIPESVAKEIRRTVSREHARLVSDGREYWIEDIGSNNFTYVNRRIVLAATRLSFPCTLRLGKCNIELQVESRPASATPKAPDLIQGTNRAQTVETLTLGLSANFQSGLREQLHWAAALLEISSIAAYGRRADDVRERVKDCLARRLGAVSADLLLRVESNDIQDSLQLLGMASKDAGRIAGQLATVGSEAPVKSMTIPGGKTAVWAILRPEVSERTSALVVVRYGGQSRSSVNSEQVDPVVAVCVRLAAPIIEALEENQSLRAAVKDSVLREPSEGAWAACCAASMWGSSQEFRYCVYCAEQAARRYLPMDPGNGMLPTVFVLGESGTGKSALCKLIHTLGDRARKPFCELNCAAIPTNLAESELFGYVKGAFSEAHKDKPGFFQTADGGTLFLDEIGKTSTEFQSKILKVLDSGEYRRIGSTETRRTTCHVILAAAEDPEKLVKDGRLLAELWFRTGAFTITMPPLRDRPGDIRQIVNEYLSRINRQLSPSERKALSPRALNLFMAHPWPGNVRELLGRIRAAHALAPPQSTMIDVDNLPGTFYRDLGADSPDFQARIRGVDTSITLDNAVERLEREYYAALIGECEGNLAEVARRAQKSYQTVHTKLKTLREWLNTATDPAQELEKSRLRAFAGEYWHVIERTPDE